MKVKTVGGLLALVATVIVLVSWDGLNFQTSRNPGEGPERTKYVKIATLGNRARATVSFSMHRGLVPVPVPGTISLPASVGEDVAVVVTGQQFNTCLIRQVDQPGNENAHEPSRPDATAKCKITVLP